jgi:hypothetical protein
LNLASWIDNVTPQQNHLTRKELSSSPPNLNPLGLKLKDLILSEERVCSGRLVTYIYR